MKTLHDTVNLVSSTNLSINLRRLPCRCSTALFEDIDSAVLCCNVHILAINLSFLLSLLFWTSCL